MFMRYLSHEMRTPLNTVVMGVNLLITSKFRHVIFSFKSKNLFGVTPRFEVKYDVSSHFIDLSMSEYLGTKCKYELEIEVIGS